MTYSNILRIALTTVATAVLAGCSADTRDETPGTSGTSPSAQPTGRVIIVEMITDDKGNYFSPAEIEAHQGDMLRFVLKSGVHNVHFPADSNAGKSSLPPASDMLQLPGQELDIPVSFAPGKYYFQCDPHALLGMIGSLEVEDENDD